MKIKTDINEIQIKDWNSFIASHPEGTVFQSFEMYQLFEDSKNYSPVILVAEKQGNIVGVLLAVIIKEYSGLIGFFSARTLIYGGPIISTERNDREEILKGLLSTLNKKVKNHSIFIQFRNFNDQSKFKEIFESYGFKYLERLNYIVNTSSQEEVERRMSNSKKRQLKLGLKNGAEIISPENEQQVKAFYDILANLYQNKIKKPLPDYSFFLNFYLLSENQKLGIIRLIKYKDKIIGGILSPVFDKYSIYEWYICGLDKEYKNCYPSVLATWAAIEYAFQNNILSFDFMGVGVPDKKYGVRDFKSKFGGKLVNYGRFGKINNRLLYAVTELGYNILSAIGKI